MRALLEKVLGLIYKKHKLKRRLTDIIQSDRQQRQNLPHQV